jgi:hypothetical protein
VNRRAAISAAVIVGVIFFLIRFGIRLLAEEAAPPPSPVVDRSRSSPVLPLSREQAKRDARAKLMMLASEARAAHETNAATAAYDAEQAIGREDCAAAKVALRRAEETIAKDSLTRGALESANRSLDAYCATAEAH